MNQSSIFDSPFVRFVKMIYFLITYAPGKILEYSPYQTCLEGLFVIFHSGMPLMVISEFGTISLNMGNYSVPFPRGLLQHFLKLYAMEIVSGKESPFTVFYPEYTLYSVGKWQGEAINSIIGGMQEMSQDVIPALEYLKEALETEDLNQLPPFITDMLKKAFNDNKHLINTKR